MFSPRLNAESPPKCLSRFPCSDILYGNRIEDFSSDCWLENRLHHFGLPARDIRFEPQSVAMMFDGDDDSVNTSTDSSIVTDYQGPGPMSGIGCGTNRPRLDLEELFMPLDVNETDVDNLIGYSDTPEHEPPPYTEFTYTDAPPTYEEAVGDRRARNDNSIMTVRSSCSGSSHSSSLAFLW